MDPEEAAHDELPLLDRRCLQNQLLSFLEFNKLSDLSSCSN